MVNYKDIGKKIAYFRKKAKITQQKLAEEMDLSVSYIGQIERGITKISLERLYQIANILDVDVVFLLAPNDVDNSNLANAQISEIIKNLPREFISYLSYILMKTDEYFKEIDKEKKWFREESLLFLLAGFN